MQLDILTAAAIFLLGGGAGVLARYLRENQLLRLYGDLVEQLSAQLAQANETRPQPPAAPAVGAKAADRLPAPPQLRPETPPRILTNG